VGVCLMHHQATDARTALSDEDAEGTYNNAWNDAADELDEQTEGKSNKHLLRGLLNVHDAIAVRSIDSTKI
jgi:hypothetical protein